MYTAKESRLGAIYPLLKGKICITELKCLLKKELFSILRNFIIKNKMRNAKDHH
jgi:hypothetical protein